jgi:hypothetical protein
MAETFTEEIGEHLRSLGWTALTHSLLNPEDEDLPIHVGEWRETYREGQTVDWLWERDWSNGKEAVVVLVMRTTGPVPAGAMPGEAMIVHDDATATKPWLDRYRAIHGWPEGTRQGESPSTKPSG